MYNYFTLLTFMVVQWKYILIMIEAGSRYLLLCSCSGFFAFMKDGIVYAASNQALFFYINLEHMCVPVPVHWVCPENFRVFNNFFS